MKMLKREKAIELQRKANKLRKETLEMCIMAETGHVTSSFSCTEILTSLYFGDVMRYDSKNPKWENRDRFILSKGQASPILYVTLAEAGFFPKEWLNTFCQADGHFGVHLQRDVPGVEFTTGSLGHGLGLGVGKSLAAKMDRKDYHTFVLLGDAELQEGSNWEAAMTASQYKLDNLTAIVDRNGFGVLCSTEQSAGVEPLDEKFKAYGWETTKVDGHSIKELSYALSKNRAYGNKPRIIIAYTNKGKGIKSWENVPLKHGIAPKGEEIEKLRKELEEYTAKGEYEND
jgi:transketolase